MVVCVAYLLHNIGGRSILHLHPPSAKAQQSENDNDYDNDTLYVLTRAGCPLAGESIAT